MDSTELVAQLIAVAATTALKTKGENFVQVKLLQGEALQQLACAIADYGVESQKKNFDRDGHSVANS